MTVTLRLLSVVNKSTENTELTSTQSDYLVILAALFCALICALGLLMAARCVCLRHPVNLFMATPILQTSAPPPPGLSKKTLQQLPITNFRLSNKQTDCAICLTEFSEGDEMRVLPRCGHVFHVSCVDVWLGAHSSCPKCRELVMEAGQCVHCGRFSGHQGVRGGTGEGQVVEVGTLCRQDYVRSFLP